MFLLNLIVLSPFVYIFDIIYLFAAEFKEPKNGEKSVKYRDCDVNG